MLLRRFSKFPLRKSNLYNQLTDKHISEFYRILGRGNVLEGALQLQKYNEDWTRKYKGNSSLVLLPTCTEEISEILAFCNSSRLAVVPQGGNTGLVGGSVPVFDEIILSMEKMNRIISHDPLAGVVQTEAGVILATLEDHVGQQDCTIPLDLGAKGSCQIGGNVATNAGGLRLLRYGSLHGNVLGLKVVLADGTILDNMNRCRKDNTGFDLKQLFIGSEGTLGVITAVSLLTPPKPTSINVCCFTVDSYDKISKIYTAAKRSLNEILSAFEFWDYESQENHQTLADTPLYPPKRGSFAILMETSGFDSERDADRIFEFIDRVHNEELVMDGTMAQDEGQKCELWSMRESIPEKCSKSGLVLKYDISLPTNCMYDPVRVLRDKLEGAKIGGLKGVVGYGHYGDGNIHINIIVERQTKEIMSLIEPFIYKFIQTNGGSISAEHGIGQLKNKYLHYSRKNEEIILMKRIKDMMDPNYILNPYKVLPPSS